ncbi:MAG TPA: MFS transporter [Aliidongia sp.]|uniref:MFS transporter n=1 Tax=Aliidongia sp. TaxID=1914230 RepID=UPI002DDD3836|nr:MFS transporter [Aliidongia sp.]HEV2677086.1 MFS transporter [Aliidongia sp.]
MPTSPPPRTASRTREVVAATIGTFFEWYDLLIYGTFAVVISHQFFPASNPTVGLFLTLLTFASAYLVRPLGAVLIGQYADRSGRKKALVLSAGLMLIGTLITGILPNYESIGVAAPALLVAARLLQGFSAGGEFGSANTYLAEQNPRRRAFFASLQFSTTGLAIVVAATFGFVLNSVLAPEAMNAWGWRVPFLFGLLIGPVALYIRQGIAESPDFEAGPATAHPLRDALRHDKLRMLVGAGVVCAGNVASYVNIYMPTYAITQLHLPPTAAFAGSIAGGLVSTIFPMVAGILADRFGNVIVMSCSIIVGIVIAYPLFLLLHAYPTVGTLALIQAVIGLVFYSFYYAPVGTVLTQLFPASRRTIGSSISYVASQTFFGGITPVVVLTMIDVTGNPMSPGIYLSVMGCVGLFSLLVSRRMGVR